jgi:hypothetical protein
MRLWADDLPEHAQSGAARRDAAVGGRAHATCSRRPAVCAALRSSIMAVLFHERCGVYHWQRLNKPPRSCAMSDDPRHLTSSARSTARAGRGGGAAQEGRSSSICRRNWAAATGPSPCATAIGRRRVWRSISEPRSAQRQVGVDALSLIGGESQRSPFTCTSWQLKPRSSLARRTGRGRNSRRPSPSPPSRAFRRRGRRSRRRRDSSGGCRSV